MAAIADVSVVIPAYQARMTIKRALSSIAAQTVKPLEVIVIDDGSSDGTADVARQAAEHFAATSLTVIEQPNLGPGAARNEGIRQARAGLIAFLDADDEWLPEKIAQTLPWLDRPQTVLVGHDFIRIDGANETEVSCSELFGSSSNPFVGLYRKGFIATSTVIARRDALLAAGGFDQTLPNAQDFDLWLKLLAPPKTEFQIFDGKLTRYHLTEGSVTTHTARRQRCTLSISKRYVAALRQRDGSCWTSFWYRIVAVHYESVAAYVEQRRFLRVFGVLAALPFRLILMTASALPGIINPRRSSTS